VIAMEMLENSLLPSRCPGCILQAVLFTFLVDLVVVAELLSSL
jgi:hypothetical protein